MPEPTPDTPQERDDKAFDLAEEFKRFKLETRLFYALVILYFISEIF